jgi:hypothetical protein
MKLRLLVLASLFVVGCVILFLVFWEGYWWQPSKRATDIKLADLLIGVSDFPGDWYLEIEPTHIPDRADFMGSRDAEYVQFKKVGATFGVDHTVIHEHNVQQAAYWFHADDQFAGGNDFVEDWATPKEFGFQSRVADQFRLACATIKAYPDGTFQICRAVGQYDEYISVLSVRMIEKNVSIMSFTDMDKLLQVVDDKMAMYVKNK